MTQTEQPSKTTGKKKQAEAAVPAQAVAGPPAKPVSSAVAQPTPKQSMICLEVSNSG